MSVEGTAVVRPSECQMGENAEGSPSQGQTGAHAGGALPACITCSDQLLALTVTEVDEDSAVARGTIDGQPAEVSVELLTGVRVGDELLCHGGVALQRSDPLEVGG